MHMIWREKAFSFYSVFMYRLNAISTLRHLSYNNRLPFFRAPICQSIRQRYIKKKHASESSKKKDSKGTGSERIGLIIPWTDSLSGRDREKAFLASLFRLLDALLGSSLGTSSSVWIRKCQVIDSFGGVASSGSAVNSCSRSEGKAINQFNRQRAKETNEINFIWSPLVIPERISACSLPIRLSRIEGYGVYLSGTAAQAHSWRDLHTTSRFCLCIELCWCSLLWKVMKMLRWSGS